MESTIFSIVGLNIRNFMGLKHVDIDFTNNGDPRRSFPIFGGQGAGKSTIIRALQWCAYGADNSGRLSPNAILPKHWKGKVEEDLSVMIRFRPNASSSTASDDVYCTRIRKKGSGIAESVSYRDDVEAVEDRASVQKKFKQIFGKKPAYGVGTMWVIRSEEMKKVASSISGGEESYFLEFMNMDITKDSLTSVITGFTKRGKEKEISGSNKTNLRVLKEEAEAKMNKQKAKVEELDKKRQALKKWLLENTLSTSDEERAKSKEAYGEAKLKLRENELTLKEKQFGTDAVSDLVNSLLFSTLKSKRIDIPIAHERDKFDWDAIADYCASTKYFDSEVIENLRNLETGVGFDTSGLTGTRPSELAGRISELKDSIKNFYVSKERVDDFEDSGIDSASISSAAKKSEEIQEKVHLFDKTKEDIAIEREELDSNKLQHKDFDSRYQAALEAGSEAEKINKKIRIARAIHTAIQETDEEYKNETFSEMLTSVSSFWQKIDQDGKYIPELSKGTINLKRKADGALFPITVDQNTGEASGGESQLLLVCICLALAEKSGAKMPIILDDCFTDVDKPTRRELVKTVCESFDSMIFVTNDEDKASLMEGHSDGTLELRQWGEDRISVDDEEWDEWRVWK